MSAAQQSILRFKPRRLPQAKTDENVRAEDFEATALPHLNELFRSTARLVGSSAEAEDLIQETYFQAWKSFHRFELGTNCRAWLFRILFSKANHHCKWLFWRKKQISGEVCSQPTRMAIDANRIYIEGAFGQLFARLTTCRFPHVTTRGSCGEQAVP